MDLPDQSLPHGGLKKIRKRSLPGQAKRRKNEMKKELPFGGQLFSFDSFSGFRESGQDDSDDLFLK